MNVKSWRQRILASTRGRVLSLLRRGPRTVAELAQAIGLTDNAVRLHLASLERDGLIEQEGARRETGGKPAYLFQLTAEAETLFPKGYAAVLDEVLGYVREQQGAEGLERFLRAVGRRAGEQARTDGASLRDRVDAAVALLGDLGGLADVEEAEDSILIHGYSCPLAALVRDHPEACTLAEELLGGVIGAEVAECCDRRGAPRCAFRVARQAAGQPA
jgi:predicted ArsR family transcriptional regulator